MEQSLLDHVDHIKEGRSEQDILYELLLKRGLDLCASIEARDIAGRQVNAVDDGALIACLAEEIAPAEVEELALGIAAWRDELDNTDDTTVVFPRQRFLPTTWPRPTAPRFCGSAASATCEASDEISV